MRKIPESVSFDRAADGYDRTRALHPAAAGAQTDLLLAQIGALGGLTLEVGVGTGRIAVPLAGAGLDVVGVDISRRMLAQLVGKGSTVRTVLADARRLPFNDAQFSAVIACHVLHLIPDWPATVHELLRVLRPPGVLLVSRGRPREGLLHDLEERIVGNAGASRHLPGLDDLDALDALAAEAGFGVRHLPPVDNPAVRSAAEFLDRVADSCFAWTWEIPADRLSAAVADARAWVRDRFGDPGTVQIPAQPIRWRAYSGDRPAVR